ncbi:TatD family hydrolase [candidate division WOR-3 bacterium]|nr:TatD family hydrolase [candidate division WOR-3 bacterium]
MTLTDTHAHLQDPRLIKDIGGVLERAASSFVEKIVVVSYDEQSSETAAGIALGKENLYFTAGCHPHYAGTHKDKTADWIEHRIINRFGKEKLVAIGETGIDMHYGFSDIGDQIKVFEEQLSFAVSNCLPVVVHSRNAMEKTMEVLKGFSGLKTVLHSFEGTCEQAKKCLDMDYFLSFNGILTFKNSDRADILKCVGFENVVLETDCPYLAPVPYRGKVNEPCHLIKILDFVAEYLGTDREKASQIIEKNVSRLFSFG